MMERHKPPLNVRAGAHLLRRSEQNPHPPGVHGIEEELLRCVRLGVMDERDLAGGDTRFDELRTDFVVDVESFRIGRGKVAEDKLGRASRPESPPRL